MDQVKFLFEWKLIYFNTHGQIPLSPEELGHDSVLCSSTFLLVLQMCFVPMLKDAAPKQRIRPRHVKYGDDAEQFE